MATAALVVQSVADTSAAAAEQLIGARVVKKTQQRYRCCLKQIEEYFVTHLHYASLTVPLPQGDILRFFGWLTTVKFKPPKLAANSTVRSYKSALKWYYKEKKVTMEPDVDQAIETLLQGYQRTVAQEKALGLRAPHEGKLHLTYSGYCLLTTALFHTEFKQMLFAWPFMVLQWNLITRCGSVAAMMMQHINWEGDALLITIPKSKADQEGNNSFPRHLYANPLQPVICPVLALAVVVFTRIVKHDSARSSDSTDTEPFCYRVFDGEHSESRFSDILGRIIAAVPDAQLPQLGTDRKQLGTHSLRKGAASYCVGMVNGPSTVQVFLRAGWGLGMQSRYLFIGAGGDQLTGRVLSGLPFNDPAFATLPPHFDEQGLAQINWPAVMPVYARLPESFKRAIPHLLASLCYHEQWLRTALPARHPLFHTYLFASGEMRKLAPLVVTGRSHCPLTGMQATGVPQHLVLSNELIDVAKQTAALKAELLAKCTELPAELVNVMMGRFSINGAIPVTIDDIKTLLNNAVNQMRTELRDAIPTTVVSSPIGQLTNIDADPRFQLWTWKGRMHMVPEGWQFPSTDVKATWNLWYYGHVQDRIRPLRYLKKADLQGSTQITQWSKTNGVMAAIAATMVEQKVVETVEAVARMAATESAAAFDAAIVQLMEKVKAGSTQGRGRWMEMSIGTLYNHLKAVRVERKRKRDEQQQAGPEAGEERQTGQLGARHSSEGRLERG
jgi:hypothetical protein